MSIYTAYANSIVLQIDEANRTLTSNNETNTIILGVRGDDCAERVYFESPKQLSPEIDLLESSDTVKVHVYVNYRNAFNEPYIQECTDVAQSSTGDTVNFSWIVTNKATVSRGEVKFNVCVKRTVYNAETDKWELTNEWHTTTFVGKVLDSIDVTKKTPEVITHDSVTIEQLTVQTNAYANAVTSYAENLETLNESLADVNAYVDTVVGPAVTSEVDAKMENYVTSEEFSSETEDIRSHIENKLDIGGGQMSGNIEFAGGGIVYNNPQQTASGVAGGWIFNVNGYPMIVSDELKICASTENDPFLMPLTYNLPAESGTLARLEDIPTSVEIPKYYEHRIHINLNDMSYDVSGEMFFNIINTSSANYSTSETVTIDMLLGVLKTEIKSLSKETAISATGYIYPNKKTATDVYLVNGIHANTYPQLIVVYFNAEEAALKEVEIRHMSMGGTVNVVVTDTVREIK